MKKRKISGACGSFVPCLDYFAISPFIYFKMWFDLGQVKIQSIEFDNFDMRSLTLEP